ncbi:glycosyltransferase family 39 protein [Jatrophihabitans sp.]|uniref:glycosyltransferase family 39 protein n=1 Tax=Jatrophihabitans sp. TaxID=1932789 RepID=UPI002D09D86C|nr:glycosyltransferase family 39 protein [Jatrophihabitans sp.]
MTTSEAARSELAGDRPADGEQRLVVRRRRLVLGLALLFLLLKATIAARTYGTNDIRHWTDFVNGVAERGPVGVYGITFERSFYNHPPVIGYFLWLVDLGRQHGLGIGFSIRSVASLADVGSALLVFEILRRRRSLREAGWAAGLVAASPVLVIISGFHGNTDPVFVLFTLLALHLLADRDKPLAGGLSMGIAIGIKVVPVVAIPALLVLAFTRGRRSLLRFGAGFLLAFGISWLPALIAEGKPVREHVLGYAGSGISQWGLIQIGHWFDDPGWADFLTGTGRFPIVLLCAAVPAVLVWRRPAMAAEAVGLSLVSFLFLSPAFGCQYLVWAMAAAYLLNLGWATAYNLGAGLVLFKIYTRWAHGFPWNHADYWGLVGIELVGALLLWGCLGVLAVLGVRRILRAPEPAAQTR